MNFADDPRRSELESMHEKMEIWADFWKDRPVRNVSITWIVMNSIRMWSNKKPKEREHERESNPWSNLRRPYAERTIIAERVRRIIHDQEAWKFHATERRILVTYYLKVKPAMPIGAIARKLDCKPWQVERLVKDALYYLSTIWKD